MAASRNSNTDVLIVGAGPTGLTMACELARHGVTPRIIDKSPTPSVHSKAFGIHARTLELFETMGIVETVLGQGNICNGFDMYNRGKPLAHVNFDTLESRYPYFLILAQSDTERILNAHMESFGIRVEREKELVGIERTNAGITARLKLEDGSEEFIDCWYVAGCDGAHSTSRHLLDLEFKGAPYPNYWLLADCDLDWKYPLHHLSVFIHPSGVTAYFPLYSDRGRLMFELPDATIDMEMAEPTIEDVRRHMKERQIDYKSVGSPNWLAYFKLHHRMVDKYGEGRVFLCGDSAHIHSPIGGQGMNTGIQDAYNLAWKLALVLKGNSPENLLDSYNPERRRVGESVVGLTDMATRMVGIHNPVLAAIRNKLVGTISKLDPVQEKLLTTLSQIEVNYRESPIVGERWYQPDAIEGFHGYRHDLVAGERVKDYPLGSLDGKGGARLYDLFRDVRHKLLLFTGAEPEDMELNELRKIRSSIGPEYGDIIDIHVIAGTDDLPADLKTMGPVWRDKDLVMHRDFGAAKASLYLIRPDSYIGFRNQPASLSDLREYLPVIFL
ncbi:MAG TPA: FAD-dependent monooxygenase [Thermodesulfobacteriota bacterium]|nr:FAD-dependent monooxygenase [Thermodesulfobacteriota bacterium]